MTSMLKFYKTERQVKHRVLCFISHQWINYEIRGDLQQLPEIHLSESNRHDLPNYQNAISKEVRAGH